MRRALLLGGITLLALAAPAWGATTDVQVRNFAFSPSAITIQPGDSVRWTFSGPDLNHSVTADPGQTETFDSDPGDSSPLHAPGDQFSHTFVAAGSFTYYCKVHSYMRGRVDVQAPGSGPPPDTTAPTVSSLNVKGGTRKRRTRIAFSLSEDAGVRMTFRRKGGKSPKPLTRQGTAGKNVVRVSRRRVRPGRYTLRLVATDAAGNASPQAKTSFRVR
jgi:plastocyanin